MSDDQMDYNSDAGPELVAARIKTFFDRAPCYKWEGQIGRGANGAVYKFIRSTGTRYRRLAVKICPLDVDLGGYKSYDEEDEDIPDELQSLMNEKVWLHRLRNGLHIIKSLDLPNDPLDPLNATHPGVWPHRMRSWIFMELAENGGLETFVGRHQTQYDGQALPNRLLWRLFMCLVRACLEMAYYNASLDGRPVDPKTASLATLNRIQPGDLAHMDLGQQNVVLGATALDASTEHNVTPILKVIDFGEALMVDAAHEMYHQSGSDVNVRQICEVMVYVVLQRREDFNNVIVTFPNVGTFETRASPIVDNYHDLQAAGVDDDLLLLLCKGTSMDLNVRPGLLELAYIVADRVMNRGDNGVQRETDQDIKLRVSSIINDGVTEPRKRKWEGDHYSDGGSPPRRRRGVVV
ncbi:uncharacterized protein F4807DRAFT_463477 [Annulohypoxylon truncatum]|uniref:uncharacterized protein n=1 Tax=Annulohypoxylon truncatum TaxID=327061 RepID=UPI00200797FE|nr:uncharacterized protein F4807DRAFT_463477 [Annulohypoxylon truncatum]KAI1206532.1 hypothetical protein F4807DRAFT_463477 [Annulohypoxylon truncatum]